jgi:nucleolar MIF4G domain-containing protein 1
MAKKLMKKRSRPPTIQTQISDRKAKRKDDRKTKKKKLRITNDDGEEGQGFTEWANFHEQEISKEQGVKGSKAIANPPLKENVKENKKKPEAKPKEVKPQKKSRAKGDIYEMLDADTAAAIRKDDEEIAFLEKNLGLNKGSRDKKKLNKEYAKLEGYGDDFGDFLDGLDNMLDKISGDTGEDYNDDVEGLEYDSDESDPAAARAKFLLRQELMQGAVDRDDDDSMDDSEEEGEEMVPMKGISSNDSSDDEEEFKNVKSDAIEDGSEQEKDDDGSQGSSDGDGSSDDSKDDDDEEELMNRDHDEKDTYQPMTGQDLYGNTVETPGELKEPTKYVPPHLRKKQEAAAQAGSLQDDTERQEALRMIQRLLNNNLNRLSDNTLESVAKAIASIYKSSEYSSRDINEKYWANTRATCVPPHMVMASLIPIYIACVAGVHFQTGDAAQLGGHVLESVVLDLWEQLKIKRQPSDPDDVDSINTSKEASNLMMIICYLYNYNVVHCTIMYDIIRQLIKSFCEIDVELLLLILSYCGSTLRSDDPTALKDIVLLVQERSLEVINANKSGKENSSAVVNSSRAQFMISAITDLKNNKRRSADVAIANKTSHYRKVIGRMKSTSSRAGSEPSSLRLVVQDILDIETKGRWWVVGATWLGNQHKEDGNRQQQQVEEPDSNEVSNPSRADLKQQKLLKLAAKQRMNTDLRRSIFCIIMGSDDCQDAFQKIVRASLLKGKSEREVVRVLVHCCSQEKVYNPYYAYLAVRICEHQSKCKFTFQFTLWDTFKEFKGMKARKAANIAKLVAHLIKEHKLNLNALKTIDIAPDSMPEAAIIFLTILFSNIFEAYEEPMPVMEIFQRGEPTKAQLMKQATESNENDDAFVGSGRQALKESISIFLMHYLENSPKNTKNSTFRKNLKVAIKICQEDNLDLMM